MLNEERVILMTKMASYEEHEGKKNVAIGNYFRSDYIAIQVMKSFVYASITFAVMFALFVIYDLEMFMEDIYQLDLFAFAQNVLMYYGATVIVYALVSYVVYSYRYAKAKKSLKCYYQNLKKLNALYNEQR